MDKTEDGRVGRSSTSERLIEVNSISPNPGSAKLTTSGRKSCHRQVEQHPKNRGMKTFNKVQVVYYLTRNGQLEHPHYMEVSHLATQPLRLKNVIDRLMVLRGKSMASKYSWSCKRSYKNGYVWNDLTENDVIYASEGSEYILKGSELLLEQNYSEIGLDELQIKRRQQRQGSHINTNDTFDGHNYRQGNTKHQEQKPVKKYEQTKNNVDDDDDDDEEKGSCSSSNAPYPAIQMELEQEQEQEQEESSTNSDKQPPPPAQVVPKTTALSEPKKERTRIIEEDGDPAVSTSLTRNSTVLLQLIACGGDTGKEKLKSNVGSNRSFNFSMKNSFMPCLKQQLSTRAVSTSNKAIPLRVKAGVDQELSKDFEDEDMMMVRYMSENPRFGNLQSEEKEYFSGTIVEAMNTHHQHTQSSSHPHPPVITKSSSYNERRSYKAGLQAEADIDDDKEDEKVKGLIKLCIPRKKSFSSTPTKHT